MTHNMEAFRMLLEKGDRIDINRSGMYNPVEFAVVHTNFEAFRLLLEYGANFNIDFRSRGVSLINYLIDDGMLMGSNIQMLDLLLEKYFDMISDKQGLIEKAIKMEYVKFLHRLLDKGLQLTDKDIPAVIGKPKLLELILSRADLGGISKFLLIKNIYRLEDLELIKLLGKYNNDKEIWDNVIVNFLAHSDNSLLISRILDNSMDYLVKNSLLSPYLEALLYFNSGHMFYQLLQGGKTDLVISLLEKAPGIKIMSDNSILGIAIGTKRFELVDILFKKYNVYLTKAEYYEHLLKDKQFELLMLALETGSNRALNVLHNYNFLSFYSKLSPEFARDLLFNERVNRALWNDNILHKLYNIPGFIQAIAEDMDRVVRLIETHVITNINWIFMYGPNKSIEDYYEISDDMLNAPIITLARRGGDGINMINRIFRAFSIEEKRRFSRKLTIGVILIKNIDLLTTVIDGVINSNGLHVDELDIDDLLPVCSEFIMTNIDTILRIIPGLYLKYISSLGAAISANLDLFTSSDITRKLLSGANYNPNFMVYTPGDRRSDSDTYYSQLYSLCTGVYNDTEKTPKNDAYLDLIRQYLEHPDTDVNQRNDDEDASDDYNVTILEDCAFKIKTFDNSLDYTAAETYGFFHQVIKMVLAHPSLDINVNHQLFRIISRETDDANLEGLLTTVLSHPTLDINSTDSIFKACSTRNMRILGVLLTIGTLSINRIDDDGKTPLHLCIDQNFIEGAMALVADPRIDINILDARGHTYARLAAKAGMRPLIEALAALGQTDEKQARVEREIAEYEARVAAQGRVKQTRIREALNSFDLILKEPHHTREDDEDDDGGFRGSSTPYNKSMCPFCLTYIEKENAYECVYLGGHRCPAELENEQLKRFYFGDQWQTKVFEICCVCGRPCEHHGHFKHTLEGEPVAVLLPNQAFANHWDCNEGNGGGGRLEMAARLVGMFSELKRRLDHDERLVYGPELVRELAIIANSSVRDDAIVARATSVLDRRGWNSNSKIAKYVKFNAPAPDANNAAAIPLETREPIVYHDNSVNAEDHKLQCMICLDEADNLFKPHASDEGYICDECLRRQVCASRYASVTCELGCRPKKQIYKEDVNALMLRNFCEGVAIGEPHVDNDE